MAPPTGQPSQWLLATRRSPDLQQVGILYVGEDQDEQEALTNCLASCSPEFAAFLHGLGWQARTRSPVCLGRVGSSGAQKSDGLRPCVYGCPCVH